MEWTNIHKNIFLWIIIDLTWNQVDKNNIAKGLDLVHEQ